MNDPQVLSWRVVISIHYSYDYDFTFQACPGNTAEEAIDYALEVMSDLDVAATATRAWAVKEDCISPYFTLQRVKRALFKREGAK